MPDAAPRPCVVPGCSVLISRGRRCLAHKVVAEHSRRNYDLRAWYRTPRWRALRLELFRAQAYQCAECGMIDARLELDHKTRHLGDPGRFWDRGNLQALCRACHQRKTQRGE